MMASGTLLPRLLISLGLAGILMATVRAETDGGSRGQLLANGSNKIPTGNLEVKTYRLERIKLDQPLTVSISGQYGDMMRLVITGRRFKGARFTVWVEDRPFAATPTRDQKEIRAEFLNGPNILEDGAPISVSEGGPCDYRADGLTVLPERLSVPPELRAARLQENPIIIRRIAGGIDRMSISITARELIGDYRLQHQYLRVGKGLVSQLFLWDARDLAAPVSIEGFYRIPENSQIFLNSKPCEAGGEFIGRVHRRPGLY